MNYVSWHFSFEGLCWDTVEMSVFLPSDKLIELQQLAHALLLRQTVMVCQVMFFFFGKSPLCQWPCATSSVVQAIQSDMLNVKHSHVHLSFFSPFSSSTVPALEAVSLAVVSSSLAISSSWCGYHYRFCVPSLGSVFSGF